MTDRTEVIEPWVDLDELVALTEIQDLDLLEDARRMASDTLFNFTRRQWSGVGTDTVRPCMQSCATPGIWTPLGVYNPRHVPPPRPSCGCGWISEFEFPARNVVSVTTVRLDGAVLDPSGYRLDDKDARPKLVRLGGHFWPTCQNQLLADTEPGTWSIKYTFGQLPPIGGVKACKSLAAQLAYAQIPEAVKDGRCRLPKRVTSVVRQGVTLALIDPLTLFADGLTGIAEVDMWVQSIRFGDKNDVAEVIDPMRAARVRRTS